MARKKVTDLDIVGFLLGDASENVAERVAQKVESDEKTATLHAEWSGILQAIGQERKTETALQEKTVESVMRRIKEERFEAVTSQPEALPAQWLSWRRAYVGLATAAFLALIVGLGVANNTNGSKEPGGSDDYQLLSGAGTASETDLASLPSRVRLAAVDSQVTQGPRHVDSLTAAISAVAPGGTVEIADTVLHGAVLINKPVRLLALGGNVKIGA